MIAQQSLMLLMQVSLTPINAPSMLALSYNSYNSHKLEVEVLSEVIEQYLNAQLAKDNAVEALYCEIYQLPASQNHNSHAV